jgi:uncharacterized membrane protein YfcA
MEILGAIGIGIVIGIISGLVGIGGGALLTPILIYAYHMNQHRAQGTSLAMLLAPSGLLAFWKYYRAGQADLKLGLLIALGVFLGGYFGGEWAQQLSNLVLKRIFAGFLVVIAVKMFLGK